MGGFSLDCVELEASVTVIPHGDLGTAAASQLSARLSDLIDRHAYRLITIDLRDVTSFDPAAADILAHAQGWIGRVGGRLCVRGASPTALAVLQRRAAHRQLLSLVERPSPLASSRS